MLLAGMGLACLIAVFEFIWKSRKMAVASAGDDTVRNPNWPIKFTHSLRPLCTYHVVIRTFLFQQTNFWSEMAQEVKSNFGSNGIKPNRKYSQVKSTKKYEHTEMQDNIWAGLRDSRPGAYFIHGT